MTKKQKKSLIALLVVFAVLTVGFFAVVRPLVNRLNPGKSSEPVELLEGESYYYNQGYHETMAILFPQFSRKDLYSVRVWNKETNYEFMHVLSDASSTADNYFLLGSDSDGDGSSELYLPDLVNVFPDFQYSSLYDDTSKIPTVITVTGACFFQSRVYIRANDETNPDDSAYQEILANYGLADANNPSFYEIRGYKIDRKLNMVYAYTEEFLGITIQRNVYQSIDAKGKVTYYTLNTTEAAAWSEALGDYDFENCFTPYTGSLEALQPIVDTSRSYKVYVGDRTPDRTGYYLRVDGRDVVYTTATTSVGDVVNKSLAYYVNPRIMAASDDIYASFMALDFGIWKKAEALSKIKEGAGVIYAAADVSLNGSSVGPESGMIHLLKDKIDDRLYAALLGKAVADKIDAVVTEAVPIYSPIAAGEVVEYVFYSIDGIVGVDEINRTVGTAVSGDDMILVTYSMVSGETESQLYSGVVDLTDPKLPSGIRSALVGKSIGGDKTGASGALVRCDVSFDSSYADVFTEVYKIVQIIGYATNESLSDINTVNNAALPSTGYVQIYCTVSVDGIEEGQYIILNLAGEDSYAREQLRLALAGKANGVQANPIEVGIVYPNSPIMAYTLYEDIEIVSINSYDEELTFKFVNEADRDKFHGATNLYEIVGPINRTMYTLDPDATKSIVMNFTDLVGSETVAVGLTADVIREYGLDANVFYFEYPFGLFDAEDGSDDIVTYGYEYSVAYCIYVSEKQADGTYYVASTLYDTVVKADASLFSFIDWSFTNDWMYPSILQLSIYDIAELTFDINFSDLKETHSFALSTNSKYYVYAGINSNGDPSWAEQKRVYVSYVAGEIEYETIRVNAAKVLTDNRLYAEALAKDPTLYYTQAGILVSKNGSHYNVRRVTNGINLDQMYLDEVGTAVAHGIDFDGVYNLKNLLMRIYTTTYSGLAEQDLTEAEKNAILADASNRIFNIRLRLTDGREFNFGFYRYSDGRCLIRISDEAEGTVSTELFLNATEVKGLVSSVRALANAQPIDTKDSYSPEVE